LKPKRLGKSQVFVARHHFPQNLLSITPTRRSLFGQPW
jgi:hypothetical protein